MTQVLALAGKVLGPTVADASVTALARTFGIARPRIACAKLVTMAPCARVHIAPTIVPTADHAML